ncbi:MAG TPA: phosphatidylserine/phosphatidylglycerophosphate/cardiolipin synthase family protein [Candidatus Paceibacterota bacterium]|nr:phosphatidylserine/phosphatidylglycerophosphate/cardiolipin synthase family protein [Candidatus Paceibacterota bacterium]
MKYKFFNNSEDTWLAMFEAIKGATESIYWESYIFSNDTSHYLNFFKLLRDKASVGVHVVIVLDGFGSLWFSMNEELLSELKRHGVEVLFWNDWFHRIHKKILIIDEEVAFLGGVNIAHSFKKWQDLHIKISGKKIVKSIVRSFANSYYYGGGRDGRLVSLKRGWKTMKAEIWLLDHFPNAGKFLLKRYYTEKISLATERVTIVTPYFAPKKWLTDLLKKTVERGVEVEVLIPRSGDLRVARISNNIFASHLSQYGIKFYLMNHMNHAKALVVDNRVGLLGSNNIDSQSFDFNIEASLSFEKEEMVNDLRRIVDGWKKDSVLFENGKHNHKWYYRPLEIIFSFIAQIIG